MADPTLIAATDLTWGITAETGAIVDKYDESTRATKKEVKNEQGVTCALAIYDHRAEVSISGYAKGATGIMAATLGAALTVANLTSKFGVTAGTIIVDEATLSKGNEDFMRVDIKGTRYPLITLGT